MKKLFLLSALALGMATAQADDFNNYFKVMHEGKEVENGATINVTGNYLDFDEEHLYGLYYACDINVINLGSEPRGLYGSLDFVKPATEAEYPKEWLVLPKLCFEKAYGNPGNCLTGNDYSAGAGSVIVPPAGTDTFEWKVDYEGTTEDADATLNLLMIPKNGEEEIDGADFNITFVFKYSNSAVEGIAADDSAVEYYNMQGMRVQNPEKGLYIVKQGNKVSKRVF